MEISVYKARPLNSDVSENLTITATEVIPEQRIESGSGDHEQRHIDVLDADAIKIVDAMVATLPGGTISRIHALLTRRYVNQLAVAWKELAGNEQRGELRHDILKVIEEQKELPYCDIAGKWFRENWQRVAKELT